MAQKRSSIISGWPSMSDLARSSSGSGSGSDSNGGSDSEEDPLASRGGRTPSAKPSQTYVTVNENTRKFLAMLRRSINVDEWELKESNKLKANDIPNDPMYFEPKSNAEEDPDNNYEDADAQQDHLDRLRLSELEKSRPYWLSRFLKIAFHACVFVNFFMSLYDSLRALYEDAKMDYWLLSDQFNCLILVPRYDALDHSMNILHATLSVSVLYVKNRRNATLCLAWICSQAVHTMFKTCQYFFNLKFARENFRKLPGFMNLVIVVTLDGICALILLHKYYDLTDKFRKQVRVMATRDTDKRSLNDKIIYKHTTEFMKRKILLREVTTAQTSAIINKIGNHIKKGLTLDKVNLDRDIKAASLALADCATVDNRSMVGKLKEAYARRLRELENDKIE